MRPEACIVNASVCIKCGVGLQRIHHLIDADTNAPFTEEDMTVFACQHAPSHIKGSSAVHEWIDALMSHWPDIADHIPDAVVQAATAPYTPRPNTYVVFMPDVDTNEPHFYTRAEKTTAQEALNTTSNSLTPSEHHTTPDGT